MSVRSRWCIAVVAVLVLVCDVTCSTPASATAQNAQPVVQKLVGKGQLDKTLGPVRTPHKVGAAEASSIARALPGEETPMKALKYEGREKGQGYQPPQMCYVFEFTHDFTAPDETVRVRDDSAPNGYREKTVPCPPLKAYVRIEESTGRVLSYTADDYTCYKNIGKPRIRKEDLMPLEQAVKTVERHIHRAGLPMSGMRLTTVFLSERTQLNFYHCALTWKRFVNKPGFGDVEYPEAIVATIDAQTGELALLSYKEYPPYSLQITTPKLSRQQAEKIALETCVPERSVLTMTNLMVYVGRDPSSAIDPVLTWHVRYYANDEPEQLYLHAVIDADTGKVLQFSRVNRGE